MLDLKNFFSQGLLEYATSNVCNTPDGFWGLNMLADEIRKALSDQVESILRNADKRSTTFLSLPRIPELEVIEETLPKLRSFEAHAAKTGFNPCELLT